MNVNRGLKFFFTLYVWLIFFITLIPTWLLVLIMPKKIGSRIAKYWGKLIFILIFCPLQIRNPHHVKFKNQNIYIANHFSYTDSLVLLAILPSGTLFIGKKELMKVPILSSAMKKLGYLTVDRKGYVENLKDTETIRKALEKGHSIVIYPEGTFTPEEGLRTFKTGAFKLAVDLDIPLYPISLQNTRKLLRAESCILSPTEIIVTISEPLIPVKKDWQEVVRLKQKARKIIAYYCGESSL